MSAEADPGGVRFADVEEALRDRDRLQWLLPVIDGLDTATANARTNALAAGLVRGLSGRSLVDHARGISP